MSTSRYDALTQALHRAGYRLTPQRLAICQELAASREHPSPGQVYELVSGQFPSISLATVYNTLAVLRDLGEIFEVGGDVEGARGAVRYETDLTPHVNLICLNCGRIIDLPLAQCSEVATSVQSRADFDLRGLRIDGFGLCSYCR